MEGHLQLQRQSLLRLNKFHTRLPDPSCIGPTVPVLNTKGWKSQKNGQH